MLELLAVFVVIARLSVFFPFCRRPPQEPSFKSKMPFGGRVAHPKTGWGSAFLIFPKWVAGGVQSNICFRRHFWTGKSGR